MTEKLLGYVIINFDSGTIQFPAGTKPIYSKVQAEKGLENLHRYYSQQVSEGHGYGAPIHLAKIMIVSTRGK